MRLAACTLALTLLTTLPAAAVPVIPAPAFTAPAAATCRAAHAQFAAFSQITPLLADALAGHPATALSALAAQPRQAGTLLRAFWPYTPRRLYVLLQRCDAVA